MFSSSSITAWGTYLSVPRWTRLLFRNLRLLISPWSLMIFRTCSGGKSYEIRHPISRQTLRVCKKYIHLPTFPCLCSLPYVSHRNVFSASVSTSEIFEPKLQEEVASRKASLSEASLMGVVASRGRRHNARRRRHGVTHSRRRRRRGR